MIIKFSPQIGAGQCSLSKQGETITVDGETFDFSGIAEGDYMDIDDIGCPFIVNHVRRIDGQVIVKVRFGIGQNASANQTFPEDLIDPPDGAILFPEYQEMEVEHN